MTSFDAIAILGLYLANAKHKQRLQSETYKNESMAAYWKTHVDAFQMAIESLAKENTP